MKKTLCIILLVTLLVPSLYLFPGHDNISTLVSDSNRNNNDYEDLGDRDIINPFTISSIITI